MEKPLESIEAVETRIIEIIDEVIDEVYYFFPIDNGWKIGVAINEDLAYEHEQELHILLAGYYEAYYPRSHPEFLLGEVEYQLKLEEIIFFLTEDEEIDIDDEGDQNQWRSSEN